jgi:hypothetical protein
MPPLLLIALLAGPADGFRVELLLGAAQSLASNLTVEQEGAPTLEVDADWAGQPFVGPLYYSLRVSHWSGNRGWSLGAIHHKLYLENPPPEIEYFSVSHGYNLLTLERGFVVSGFVLWVGGGLVIGHPESTVRGRTWPQKGGLFDDGYYVTGPTLAVAAARRFPLGSRLEASIEGRFTASWARVPVQGGEADVPDRSLHLLVGLGWRF